MHTKPLCSSHEVRMHFVRTSHELHMKYMCSSNEVHMNSVRTSWEARMKFAWTFLQESPHGSAKRWCHSCRCFSEDACELPTKHNRSAREVHVKFTRTALICNRAFIVVIQVYIIFYVVRTACELLRKYVWSTCEVHVKYARNALISNFIGSAHEVRMNVFSGKSSRVR